MAARLGSWFRTRGGKGRNKALPRYKDNQQRKKPMQLMQRKLEHPLTRWQPDWDHGFARGLAQYPLDHPWMANDGIEPKAREKKVLSHQYRYLKTNKHNKYSTLSPKSSISHKQEIIVAKKQNIRLL